MSTKDYQKPGEYFIPFCNKFYIFRSGVLNVVDNIEIFCQKRLTVLENTNRIITNKPKKKKKRHDL